MRKQIDEVTAIRIERIKRHFVESKENLEKQIYDLGVEYQREIANIMEDFERDYHYSPLDTIEISGLNWGMIVFVAAIADWIDDMLKEFFILEYYG